MTVWKRLPEVWKALPRILIRIIGALLALAMLGLACVALILGQPEEKEEDQTVQPLLSPSPATSIQEEGELRDLVATFPAPVMSFMSGSGMVFVSGTSADAALGGGFGRVLTLNWQTPAGEPVMLQSIYPAEGLELLKGGGFHFSRVAGPTLFGRSSVRMEAEDRIRVHAVTEKGIYTVTVPKGQGERLGAVAQSLQLFTVD